MREMTWILTSAPKVHVVEAIKKIKNGKATDPDNIPPEVMKAATGVTADTCTVLIFCTMHGRSMKCQRNGRHAIL